MLRMSVKQQEYILIGDDVKIVFLGGSGGHIRIMIDAPKEINIVRSSALEKRIQDPELLEQMPKYYAEPEHPEKYRYPKKDAEPKAASKKTEKTTKKKSNIVIVKNDIC